MEIVFLVALGAVLVILAAGLLWQERHRPPEPAHAVVYGVEDALDYVWERLGAETKSVLRRGDVRRILEWEMHYLQQPKLRDRPAVLGGIAAAEYVQERAYRAGFTYQPAPIFAVLDLQAAYLAELGAVGDVATEDVEGPV